MRKLLLASVAVLGASMGLASVANAQAPTPAPGTISVRLNGLVRIYAAYVSDNAVTNSQAGFIAPTVAGVQNPATNGVGTTSATGQVSALSGASKLANYTFGDYARLYPGFDGVAANGLKYGASLEIRQDQNHGAGGGTYGSISGENSARGTLYFRREFGYLGTDQLGTIRFGGTDQPSSLYITGNFENFDGGGLDGDINGLVAPAAQFVWPFADQGGVYTTTKVVYLSPQFFGFDFGVSFEPNTGNTNIGTGCGSGTYVGANFVNGAGGLSPTNPSAAGATSSGVAGAGCDRLTSTATGDYTRRRDTFDGLVRYRGSFGPVGIAATAGYITSGRVLDSSTPQRAVQYDGLSIGDFGLAVTYGGLSVGGKYEFGRFTGNAFNLTPQGVKDSIAYLGGISYTVGPVIVGAHYVNYQNTGNVANALAGRQRRESGLAVGGTYSLVPGVTLFLSYDYQNVRQNGVNLVTGEASGNGSALKNKLTSNVVGFGTSFRW